MTQCAECDAPAEIIDEYVLDSTDGPVGFWTVRCVNRHQLTVFQPGKECG